MVKMKSSTIIDLSHLRIDKLLAGKGSNKREVVDKIGRVVKLRGARVTLVIRGKIGLEYKVGSINLDQTNKPVRVSRCGHYVISARDIIWSTIAMHIITIIAVSLDI